MTTLTDPFQVIAAFVDGERIDPAMLKSALARPDGRDYLVDMVALREVVAHESAAVTSAAARRPAERWLLAAAAAIVLSLAGGYALGQRSSPPNGATTIGAVAATNDPAPPPTRVIDVAPGSSYVPKGGQ